jgi:MFS transporter, DHA1 family, multidrug resistance protein
MRPSSTRTPPSLIILIAMSAIGPMALNIFFPSMPGMMEVFDTDYGTVQLALTFYLTALATAQLFVGPISDRVGRRPVVVWGMVVCMTGSIVCIVAPTIEVLIVGRVLQALGACTGLVMGRTMIRDMHGLDKAASMMGYLTMVMVVAPMLSPTIGALLEEAFDWRASFVMVLLLTAAVLAALVFRLGETHKGPYQATSIRLMFGAFGKLLVQPRFTRHAFQISLSSGAFFAFLGGAPYVSIQLMGVTGIEYGLYFMVAGIAYMTGNFITGRMSERWGAERLVLFGTTAGLCGGIELTLAYVTGNFTPVTLFGGMGMIALGNGLCLPSGTAGAISADKNHIGAAAGLAGFMQMATGALSSYTVGVLLSDTALPLVIIMASSVTLAFFGNLVGRRYQS